MHVYNSWGEAFRLSKWLSRCPFDFGPQWSVTAGYPVIEKANRHGCYVSQL
jgi:hypothetical protein